MKAAQSQLVLFMCLIAAFLSGREGRAGNGGLPWSEQKAANQIPAALIDVGIDEKLGASIPRELTFTDEAGKEVRLGDYFDGQKTVILSPVYFSCPSLCNLHLNGLTEALKTLDWKIGKEFVVLSISFDPKETPALAQAKKASYLKAYGHPEASEGWHFLTGSAASVQTLTKQIGFKFKWDPESQQWSHSSAALLYSPAGVLTRYLHGISFTTQNLRLALLEASNGTIGAILDRAVMYCFKYDPSQRGYAFYAFNLMKGAGALTVLIMGYFLIGFWLRQRKLAVQS